MSRSRFILNTPLFLAFASIIASAVYLGARKYVLFSHIIGKHLDGVGITACALGLLGALVGLTLLQLHPKEHRVKFGTVIAVAALILSTLGLPL